MFHKLVYICSPYHGDIKQNHKNAIEYCKYAAQMGAIPLAPHTIFTQYLDDNIPSQRKIGLRMGLELLKRCDELWVFGPMITEGMEQEITEANNEQIPLRILSKPPPNPIEGKNISREISKIRPLIKE